jgi:hypothetical protein
MMNVSSIYDHGDSKKSSRYNQTITEESHEKSDWKKSQLTEQNLQFVFGGTLQVRKLPESMRTEVKAPTDYNPFKNSVK